jgi:hypothetical protein
MPLWCGRCPGQCLPYARLRIFLHKHQRSVRGQTLEAWRVVDRLDKGYTRVGGTRGSICHFSAGSITK